MKCHLCDGQYEKFGIDWYCPSCDLLHTIVKDTVSVYDAQYCEKYIRYSQTEINKELQRYRWGSVLRHARSGKILDIGCGVGAFLQAAPEGFETFGQDVNNFCVEYCNSIGLRATCDLPEEEFDVVTMFDSLEHFSSFDDIVAYIRRCLSANGHLVLGVPNFRHDLLEDIKEWRHYRPDEHVFGISETAVHRLCDKFGFEFLESNDDESKVRQPAGNISTYVLQKK